MNLQKGNLFLIIAIVVGVFAVGAVGFVSWKYFGALIENDLTNAVKFEEDESELVVKKMQEQKAISKSTIKSIEPTNKKENGETNYLECSEENPPAVYYGKGGNALNLCGEKTNFQAYEFEKENIILFQTVKWDKNESKYYYSLKTISTIYPYEINNCTICSKVNDVQTITIWYRIAVVSIFS